MSFYIVQQTGRALAGRDVTQCQCHSIMDRVRQLCKLVAWLHVQTSADMTGSKRGRQTIAIENEK